jgi:hypothetical protein
MTAASSIARQLIFYVQLAKDPSMLAAHVASIVREDSGFSRDELLVAADWALMQDDLSAVQRTPHSHAVLQQYFVTLMQELSR